jgi:hypothetical protein
VVKLHLDADLGGDIDDLCALAMLLDWPGVELLAVTTVADDRGRRAGADAGRDARRRRPLWRLLVGAASGFVMRVGCEWGRKHRWDSG